MGQMGKSNTLRMLGRNAGLGAMALAALSAALPGVAWAQEREGRSRGGWEARAAEQPSRPAMGTRAERQGNFRQRQITPRSVDADGAGAAAAENRSQGQFRGGAYEGQRRGWHGQGSANGATWQQQRQGMRGSPADAGRAEQWRERRQDRVEGQPNPVPRDTTARQQWRDRNNDGRPDVRRDGRGDWQEGRANWQGNRSDQVNTRPSWQTNRPGWQDGRREGWRNDGARDNGWRNDRRGNQTWDRGWRSNSRYNWSSYRDRNRAVYRPGRYVSPYASYRYSRVGIGFSLRPSFYGRNYWLSDPWQYRLPAVYGPYRWVRYYDDVVLVDTYTGQVVDVIYDFFW